MGIALAAFGAVFGAILTFGAPAVVRWFGRTFHKVGPNTVHIAGSWFAYHVTRLNGAAVVRCNMWTIRLRSAGDYEVRIQGLFGRGVGSHGPQAGADNPLRYRGNLARENGYLAAYLEGNGYPVHWAFQIREPIPTNQDAVPGVHLSFDFDGNLVAGPMLLSRLEADSLREIEQQLEDLVRVDTIHRMLGLRDRLSM